MVGFILDSFVPITIDHSPIWHNPLCLERWPIVNDFILLLLFWIQHRYILSQGMCLRRLAHQPPQSQEKRGLVN